MSTITCGNCKQTHNSVDEVKACYAEVGRPVAESTGPVPPSQRQLDFIEKLLKERDVTAFDGDVAASMLDKRLASALITYLLAAPKATKPENAPPVGEGLYRVDGVIYKVLVGLESGRLYAKVLRGGRFVFAPGKIYELKPENRMTLDDAAAFGKLYGQCCVCGRTLTDEVSIANGIGPVCAGKGWWSQEERDRLPLIAG